MGGREREMVGEGGWEKEKVDRWMTGVGKSGELGERESGEADERWRMGKWVGEGG